MPYVPAKIHTVRNVNSFALLAFGYPEIAHFYSGVVIIIIIPDILIHFMAPKFN